MKVQLIMTEEMYNHKRSCLFPPNDNREHFGFTIASKSQTNDVCRLLVRSYVHADQSCLEDQSGFSVRPKPELIQYAWNAVNECHGCLINNHNHPFSDKSVMFSGIDDRSENESFPKEVRYLGPGPHCSIVWGRNSVDARWYNSKTKMREPVNAIKIIGENGIRTIYPTSSNESAHSDYDENANSIHDRQILAFGKQGQDKIKQQTVGIVGCGGLGFELFTRLVHLGVNSFVLIDMDKIESSNLNRLVGAKLSDVKNKSYKVDVLARYAKEFNQDISVITINESVFSEIAQQALKSCDFIFCGTDNESSRNTCHNFALQHMIPYIDTGTGIQATDDHKIEHAGGQVRTVIPGLSCLHCINGINLDVAQQEQLPEEQRQGRIELGYIAGDDEKAPSVISLNGVIANLAVTEFMGFVTGCKALNRYFYVLCRITDNGFIRSSFSFID